MVVCGRLEGLDEWTMFTREVLQLTDNISQQTLHFYTQHVLEKNMQLTINQTRCSAFVVDAFSGISHVYQIQGYY